MFLLGILLLVSFGGTTIFAHDIKFFEQCTTVPGMKSFDLDKFYGNWFILRVFSGMNKCMTMEFVDVDDQTLEVTQRREFRLLNQIKIDHKNAYKGTITKNPTVPSEMKVKWSANPMKMDFIVVDTDYNNYAVIYECQFFLLAKRYSIAILARNRTLEESLMTKALQVAENTGIKGNLDEVIQDSCIADDEASFSGVIDEGLLNFLQIKNDPILENLTKQEPTRT